MIFRSRDYLDLAYAEGKTCLRCEKLGCEPCHYSGLFSDRLGKGMSIKAADLHAELCRECHRYFDLYKSPGGNDDARAAEFLLLIVKTLVRNLESGHVEMMVMTKLRDQTPHNPEAKAELARSARKSSASKRGTRCQRSSKTVPRPTEWRP